MKNYFFEPAYPVYEQNKLFNLADSKLNRDDSLSPFVRMKNYILESNGTANTIDYYIDKRERRGNFSETNIYWSFGGLKHFNEIKNDKNIIKDSLFIFEPPLVAPHLYSRIAEFTNIFQKVYIHNTDGDGYSLTGVDMDKLRKLYWPQPYNDVLEKYWNVTNRQNEIVIINGYHKPRMFFKNELYSKRIEAMVSLSENIPVKLYGRGWGKVLSRQSFWLPYLKNYSKLLKMYQGACESKYEVYSNYKFAICFENLEMNGYITEKIFDCFYSGVIPIYWGGRDINNYIPENCYISVHDITDYKSLANKLKSLTEEEINNYRQNARDFLRSNNGSKYYSSLVDAVRSAN